jgi:hypothetical protein
MAADDMTLAADDRSKRTGRSELSGSIRNFDGGEQVDPVALMWLGRGGASISAPRRWRRAPRASVWKRAG